MNGDTVWGYSEIGLADVIRKINHLMCEILMMVAVLVWATAAAKWELQYEFENIFLLATNKW